MVLRKVVSTGFGVPTFDAVGTPIGTKYIFSGGLFMGAYKDKGGRWYVSVRYRNRSTRMTYKTASDKTHG